MVKFRQNAGMRPSPEITPVGFRPPGDVRLNVEALSIEELRRRAPAEHFQKLQRADFYRLIGVLEGHTCPMVDFSELTAQAGDWLLVRPGQVFRYDFASSWAGWLLVFPPEGVSATERSRAGQGFDLARHLEDLASLHSLDAPQHEWMCGSLRQMQADGALAGDVTLRNELLRLQLAGTLLRLSHWQTGQPPHHINHMGAHTQFRRFRQLLEADFARHHQVQHYASTLGMSEKTLSRVCAATAGLPAKAVINQRLMLEARRLLAHTNLAVQTIGHDLGFDEATNFVKFFRKASGTTPLAFRQTHR